MFNLDPALGHLLRRAGFGVSRPDALLWGQLSYGAAVDRLVDYESVEDDVDQRIGAPGYLRTISRGGFDPDNRIFDARQRWVFRMVHTQRPLQEKMALFWHNHFATGFTKVAGTMGPAAASRAMAARPNGTAGPVRGQLELFREQALGNFGQILLAVAQDPAMIAFLDGHTNVKGSPQENFARELMELFTIGIDSHSEADVRAAARVFTGWTLRPVGRDRDNRYATFAFNPQRHDTDPKTFSFAIYPDGRRTIPARDARNGLQDGADLLGALAGHPATGPRLARKLYAFFVNEVDPADPALIQQLSTTYYATGFDMRAVVRALLRSSVFRAPTNQWTRYSWPVEYVARMIREVGWERFPAAAVLTPLANMGQVLFDPPNVSGWRLGPAWFSSGTMLARSNFAALLVESQRRELVEAADASAHTPESLLSFLLQRLSLPSLGSETETALLDYARAGGVWNGSTTQVATKTAGLAHLITGSAGYQFV